jgi:hypothetical protein
MKVRVVPPPVKVKVAAPLATKALLVSITAVTHYLFTLRIADKCVCIPGAKGDPTVAQKIIQPAGYVAQRSIAVAILIWKVFAINLKAYVVDPIRHCVDKIFAEILGVGPIILYQVEASFFTVFVISVQLYKQRVFIGFDPLIHQAQV